MSLTDSQNTGFYSNYRTDKIVGVYSGSFNSTTAATLGGFIPYTSFSHTFTRPVFVKLQISLDGTNWRDENTGTLGTSPYPGIAYSTSNSIFVLVYQPMGIVYYRVTAFWIDDYDTSNPSVPPTVGSLSKTYFDSRLNYQKIALSGKLTIPAASIALTNTVYHNLGYKPNVRVFNDMLPGQIWPANYGGVKNAWLYDLAMIETEVKIYSDRIEILSAGGVGSPASSVWYNIYYDN